jgi:hypothetical protein
MATASAGLAVISADLETLKFVQLNFRFRPHDVPVAKYSLDKFIFLHYLEALIFCDRIQKRKKVRPRQV